MTKILGLSSRFRYHIIFILCLLGLGISTFLAYEYAQPGSITCPLGGGCDIVRNSPYSNLVGISVPYFGILFYLGLSITALLSLELNHPHLYKIHKSLVISGLLASLYFTALEAFVIHAYCFWCVLSAIITLVIFALEYGLTKIRHEYEN